MMTIWKFPLEVTDVQTVRVPKDARALTAQVQGNTLCLWMLVDTKRADVGEDIPVYVHGTGHPVKQAATHARYLSTVQMCGGGLIFHVFVDDHGAVT